MVIILAGVFAALFVGFIYEQAINKRRIENRLRERFGIKPENTDYDFEEIQLLWKELYEEKDTGSVDDITWNDLILTSSDFATQIK